MMQRKYQNRIQVLVSFERARYDRVKELLLPKGISVTDELNAFLRERMLDLEKFRESEIAV